MTNQPPPRKPRKTMGWRGLGIVVATCVTLLVLLAAIKSLLPSPNRGGWPQTRCGNHLRQFGGIFTSESMEQGHPDGGGVPLLISYRRKGFIQTGREEVFTCPQDPDVHVPTTDADSRVYDSADITDPEALATLCSYAFRDLARFPIEADGTDPETGEIAWLACDRQGKDGRTPHHKDGLMVLFADGAVQWRGREALDIAPDDPIIVGPDSPHPELRKMAFVPVQVDGDSE